MDKDLPSQIAFKRYVLECLFSLNIALCVRLANARTSFSSLEPSLKWRINSLLHLQPHSSVGGYSAFFAVALALTLGMLAILRLCSRAVLAEKLLRSVAGIASLAALPVSWLYVTHTIPVVPPGNLQSAWPLLELGVAIGCMVLYLIMRWPFPHWISILFLALHFGFWTWLSLGGLYFWRAPIELVFPTAGFCACLAWGRYVAHLSPFPSIP
jgi:hypothetical protein